MRNKAIVSFSKEHMFSEQEMKDHLLYSSLLDIHETKNLASNPELIGRQREAFAHLLPSKFELLAREIQQHPAFISKRAIQVSETEVMLLDGSVQPFDPSHVSEVYTLAEQYAFLDSYPTLKSHRLRI